MVYEVILTSRGRLAVWVTLLSILEQYAITHWLFTVTLSPPVAQPYLFYLCFSFASFLTVWPIFFRKHLLTTHTWNFVHFKTVFKWILFFSLEEWNSKSPPKCCGHSWICFVLHAQSWKFYLMSPFHCLYNEDTQILVEILV